MKTIDGRQYRVTAENRGLCSIDDYVEDCGVIWVKDPERPVSDLYYHVISHASKLGEAIRRELYDDARHQLGRLAIWLFSLVKKLRSDKQGGDAIFTVSTTLSEIIWTKYPNCCPVCFGREYALPVIRGEQKEEWHGNVMPCTCLLHLADMETRSEKWSAREKQAIRQKLHEYAHRTKPQNDSEFSLNVFQERFKNIFASNLFATSIESIAFHLLEEIGEVCEALSFLYTFETEQEATNEAYVQRMVDLQGEIADVFSWVFALANKLRDVFSLPDRYFVRMFPDAPVHPQFGSYVTLSQIIWETYGNKAHGVLGCRDCNKLVCGCNIHLVTNEQSVKKLLKCE
jgi:NTP pyrophosphatase (non-canonical NTP hydrolase)